MMRSWGNRPDTVVVDEPFYAHYLHVTRADHPGADEVIAAGERDWEKVVRALVGAVPTKPVFYQKQMTHHFLPHISREWLSDVTNCFLIRDPREVIASYTKKNHEPTVEDVGFIQQAEIFDIVRKQTGAVPPVVDAHDVLENPRRTLTLFCEAVGLEFSDAMLSWPAGLRETDGIWAKHWYTEVATSTGFRNASRSHAEVPANLRSVYQTCRTIYERLAEHRLR